MLPRQLTAAMSGRRWRESGSQNYHPSPKEEIETSKSLVQAPKQLVSPQNTALASHQPGGSIRCQAMRLPREAKPGTALPTVRGGKTLVIHLHTSTKVKTLLGVKREQQLAVPG